MRLLYTEAYKLGQGGILRILLSLIVVSVLFFGGGFVSLYMFHLFQMFHFFKLDPQLIRYIFLNGPFFFIYLGLWLSMRVIHRQPFKTLITTHNCFNWRNFSIGVILTMFLLSIMFFVQYLFSPAFFKNVLDLPKLFEFLPVAVIFSFIQTSAEELFFRGYIIQQTSRYLKSNLLISVLSGVLFTLPHLANPELKGVSFIYSLPYFLTGFMYAFLTIRSNGLEFSLGSHFANNFFLTLIVNCKGSAIGETPSIIQVDYPDPRLGLGSVVISLIQVALMYLLVMWLIKPNDQKISLQE